MEAAMTIKDKTCCFTGHRDIPQAQIPALTKKLTATIQMLAAQGIIYYGAGGALGFDYEKRKVMRSEVLDAA